MPVNIDIFSENVVKALAFLYETLPTPTDIHPQTLGAPMAPDGHKYLTMSQSEKKAYGEVLKQRRTAIAAVSWLKEEGYIRADKCEDFLITKACLTEKGLALLNAIPTELQSQDKKQTIGDIAVEVVKEGTKDGFIRVIGALIGAGLSKIPELLSSFS